MIRRGARCIEHGLRFHSVVFGSLLLTVSIAGCPPGQNGDDDDDSAMGVAPGLNVEITNVAIPADLRPVVTFRVTDDNGNLIPLAELTDARFILAMLEDGSDGSTDRFVSYTTSVEQPKGADGAVQAAYDGARLGGVADAGGGLFTYKFNAALPAGFDRSATHQLAGQLERLYPVDGLEYPANPVFRFRPAGGAVTATREIVETATCNDCHTRLAVHGGARREIQLCIMCHTTQTTDAQSGNTVDFAQMIHKIHRGENLPSVEDGEPYQIIGFGGSVHDYSTVVYPQDIRNCASCHKVAPQAEVYLTTPTIEGCMSCHDRTWFGNPDQTPAGFTDHTGGSHANNALCALCHDQDATAAPVDLAHLIPTESEAAVGLNAEITDVSTSVPAKGALANVAIDFALADNSGGPIDDLSELDTLAATVAFPTPEYETFVREGIFGGGPSPGMLENLGGGAWRYTFAAGFPSDTGDTFSVGIEGRREFEFRDETFDQGIESNSVTHFTVDGSEPANRRMVVDEALCNTCHADLRVHGTLRTDVAYCLMCHNVNTTDEGRRDPAMLPGPPSTVNFKDMIHKIHTGEELNEDYTVIGFGGTPHDFNEVRFPGRREECSICHTDIDTTDLPLPAEALSTLITDDGALVEEILPETAACTSCHDSGLAEAHAAINTFIRTESCAVCHGPNAEFAVSAVHALEP